MLEKTELTNPILSIEYYQIKNLPDNLLDNCKSQYTGHNKKINWKENKFIFTTKKLNKNNYEKIFNFSI